MLDIEGEPVFEVLKNKPATNDITNISSDRIGIVTVSEKDSGRPLYKVCPDSDVSVIFAKQDGGEFSAVITDSEIRIGGMIISNHHYRDSMAGVFVDPDIGVGMMDPPIPPQVAQWLS